jgi:hypothetical protein
VSSRAVALASFFTGIPMKAVIYLTGSISISGESKKIWDEIEWYSREEENRVPRFS